MTLILHWINRIPRLVFGMYFSTLSLLINGQGISIPSGAYFIQNNYLLIGANLVNNGTFTHKTGIITFNGTTQSISGASSTTFQNITITNTSTTTLSTSSQFLSGILLCNGTLNAGGNLTLLSSLSQTALVNGSGTGTVSGNVIMQGYLSSQFGYKYLGSPFSNSIVGQFSGAVNLSASFPPLYSYNESNTATGWVTDITSSNSLSPGAGYAVNFGTPTTALTFSLNGIVNNGPLSQTLYNHNTLYTQGYNLVSNPYPSPIDWNSAIGWTKTNIDNALYFYNNGAVNQYTGTYNTYINGVSSNGIVNNIIPAMQGFFVHVTNGSFPVTGTLTINNNARNTTITGISISTARPLRNEIRLAISKPENFSGFQKPIFRLFAQYSEENSDPMVIYLDQKIIKNFDPQYDALKLMNTDMGVPNIYGYTPDNQKISILALNVADTNAQIIPLGLKLPISEKLTFEAANVASFPYPYIYLWDRENQRYYEFHQSSKITLPLNSGLIENRFALIFSFAPITTEQKYAWTAYSYQKEVFVKLDTTTGFSGTLILYSMLGEKVWISNLKGYGMHTLFPNLSDGIYIISFQSSLGIFSKKLFIGL